jgi:hypothetical protein
VIDKHKFKHECDTYSVYLFVVHCSVVANFSLNVSAQTVDILFVKLVNLDYFPNVACLVAVLFCIFVCI